MSVTAKDVAASLGVSLSTVSRALAGSPRVAPDTRRRVRTAAERMGYRPNLAARSLMTGRHGAIGVVVPDLANPFFALMCKGIQHRALPADHMVFTADTDEDAHTEEDVMTALAARVDGMILCSPRGEDERIRALAGPLPVVLVNRRIPGMASVTFDEAGAMRALLRHLMALGHRRIGYAGGPAHSWSDRARGRAFRRFADEAGEGPGEVTLLRLGAFAPQFSGGAEAADIALAQEVSAVVAYNDLMALGLIDRLRRRGRRVPDDVSVTGFDDIPAATLARPNLTTVRLPAARAGRAGLDLLFALLGRTGESGAAGRQAVTGSGPGPTPNTGPGRVPGADPARVLAGTVLVRGSTAPAAGSARPGSPLPLDAPHREQADTASRAEKAAPRHVHAQGT